ncbi:MAG: hypothetical protein SH817_10330 [Leptospira sp.]|nr:hypothetical protein [Leptospira sp.]
MGKSIVKRVVAYFYPTEAEQKKTEKLLKEVEHEKIDFAKCKFPDGTPVKHKRKTSKAS